LALLAGAAYSQRTTVLAPGEHLSLYTEGVTEAQNAAGCVFGDAHLTAAIDEFRRRGAGPRLPTLARSRRRATA
jgi:serine phosphatase RsbU (regulator of sigma subunit)